VLFTVGSRRAAGRIPAAGLRAPFHAMGALDSNRRTIPANPLDRITNVFCIEGESE
jgi:hypothetical protein